ncbi:MAG: 5-methyltetrahydropteroyltriglutamate--homocysteine S-methyltransferase, partial [Oscillospiraceae bacterium]|nr:5-methyltetrahydropteroyltriglutamate--homocysteine S-methyltransferase [Oscillospiraceae bacterium]
MKTSIIGYPRIGGLRELKFASEKYFRGEIDQAELETTAAKIRAYDLELQKNSGLDFIPSNDFSYYDGVLDTAFLFGAVPARYTSLGLSPLDTYFAAARGYQGEKGDVKALAMKKWFNTNYHYMVPEIDDDTHIHLSGSKPFDLFTEALENGVRTKPVIVGAYTFLKLARYKGEKKAADFVDEAAKAYADLLDRFASLGAEWVQFDEPSLVMDMTAEDIKLFVSLYEKILPGKKSVKVLLQTYFGDVRDCYKEICALDVDGIGLDFVEGKETFDLVTKNGFPKGKALFAGVVNGKNIWRNKYVVSYLTILGIKDHASEIVIGTSCSLLHVPCTLRNETKLPDSVRKHFAYAEEKLSELTELKKIAESEHPGDTPEYKYNQSLHTEIRSGYNEAVRDRISQLTEKDFVRLPAFAEREKIQKKRFGLPLFPTTTIGSFPQTSDVKTARRDHRRGELS